MDALNEADEAEALAAKEQADVVEAEKALEVLKRPPPPRIKLPPARELAEMSKWQEKDILKRQLKKLRLQSKQRLSGH